MSEALSPLGNARSSRVARILRRAVFVAAALLTCIVLFYTVEAWRGRRAWEKCRQELKAQGERLDWAAYVPARIPDEQNFIKTPLLEAIGYRERVDPGVWSPITQASGKLVWDAWSDFQSGRTMDWPQYQSRLRRQPNQNLSPLVPEPAADLLEALQEIEPQLDELRAASLKPGAQFDIDRSAPFEEWPDFNLVALRALSQILAFHACAELELGHGEKAFADLRVIHRFSDSLKDETTLVAAMMRVALQGLALKPFWEGWAKSRWSERELAGFQELFGRVDLLPESARVMRAERAGTTGLVEKYGVQKNELWRVATRWQPAPKGWAGIMRQQWLKFLWSLVPRGWVYQNLVTLNRHTQDLLLPGLRSQPSTVSPTEVEQLRQRADREKPFRPYGWLVGNATPNFLRAIEVTARTQTWVNEARVVCALERCRKERGQYPEALADLVPQFINPLPIDVITGRPLKYMRTDDGRFALYSVGWNEKDDGGVPATTQDAPPKRDPTRGDWVWPWPAQ